MDIERVKYCAELSVKRGLGFALLGVGCMVVGFSWEPALAFEVGAGGTLLLCVLLFFRALDAPQRDFRKTETWILLDKQVDIPADRLQSTIGLILQDLYRRYAEWLLGAAVLQWLGSVFFRLT